MRNNFSTNSTSRSSLKVRESDFRELFKNYQIQFNIFNKSDLLVLERS